MATKLLDAAHEWKELGFSVIPANAMTKKPAFEVLPRDKNGKGTWKPYQKSIASEDELDVWFSNGSKRRLAIVGGEVSGNLVVVDVDDLDLAAEIRNDSEFFFQQAAVRTPSGGLHLYLRTKQSVKSEPYGYGEIRAEGNYVLAPPSNGYRWEQSGIDEIPLVDWREWWGKFCEEFDIGTGATLKPTERIEDNRHTRLTKLAARRRHQTGDEADELYTWLSKYNRIKVDEPLDDSEIRRIADWAGVLTLNPELTDAGNATRLVDRYGETLRYSEKSGWYVWTGNRWKSGARQRVRRLAIQTARAIKDEGESLAKWSLASQSSRAINAMVDLAQADARIAIEDDSVLDSSRFLLNLLNGTLDLRTGKLQPHDSHDLITRLAPVYWDAEKKTRGPKFSAFVRQILPNPNVRRYMQRLLGYSLTGDISEQILPVWCGDGNNGKSTLKTTFLKLLGDYGMEAPHGFLDEKRNRQSNELADLRGVRAVFVSETGRSTRLAESLAKDLTGEAQVRARHLYEENKTFDATHKIHLVTNHEPIITGTDTGIWRRIKKVPFEVQIAEQDVNKHLLDELVEEQPFILRWLVQGCLDWQAEKSLSEPEEVTVKTREYRVESDIIGKFIDEQCVVGKDKRAVAGTLYNSYRAWATRRGEHPLTANTFGRELTRRGFLSVRGTAGKRQWEGIGVRTLTA